jgi:hypothetical protein
VLRPKIATTVDQSVMIPGLSIGNVAIKARSHVDYGGSLQASRDKVLNANRRGSDD